MYSPGWIQCSICKKSFNEPMMWNPDPSISAICKGCYMSGQCPNCSGEMVDSLCSQCSHDGQNVDCTCAYCQLEETADLPAVEVVKFKVTGNPHVLIR